MELNINIGGVFCTNWSRILPLQRGVLLQVFGSSHISTSILFTLLMRLHQMKPSPRSRYGRQLEDGIFVSTPSTSPPLPPSLTPRLWHRCLDFGSKSGLTKVSMATVQSVNHAAADVSSPSLFSPSLFSPSFFSPKLVHNPSLSLSLMHTFSASPPTSPPSCN